VGLFAFGTTAASGTGVLGVGNNIGGSTLTAGSGGAFSGLSTGVFARVTGLNPSTGTNQAVYTTNVLLATNVAVNYYDGLVQYKINGAGTVSTLVADPTDPTGQRRLTLHATEAPEIYFEDYGEAHLENGWAHVELDPLLAPHLAIDARHPLRVFVQLEEDEGTLGVVVKNKTPRGFDVVEIGGGTSNLPFQWHIVANRADEALGGGYVSHNADARLEVWKGQQVETPASVHQQPFTRAGSPDAALTPPADPLAPAGTHAQNEGARTDFLRLLVPMMKMR
jgi:hypothetical protein